MSVIIDVSAALALADNVGSAIENQLEGLQLAVETIVLPEVEAESASTWQVRTGKYSNGWFALPTSDVSVGLFNYADYAWPLETGWTLRNGGYKESPGVAEPVAVETAADVAGMLVQWLNSQLSQ